MIFYEKVCMRAAKHQAIFMGNAKLKCMIYMNNINIDYPKSYQQVHGHALISNKAKYVPKKLLGAL